MLAALIGALVWAVLATVVALIYRWEAAALRADMDDMIEVARERDRKRFRLARELNAAIRAKPAVPTMQTRRVQTRQFARSQPEPPAA